MKIEDAVEVLSRTPAALDALLGGVSDEWASHEPNLGWWSARDVLGHLIHGEQTDWIPRLRFLVTYGDSKPFEPIDRDGWERAIGNHSLAQLLLEFESLRASNLSALRTLPLNDVDRKGMHPAFGTVTLGQLIATWAVHDLNHLSQITEAMAKRYRKEIGPWRAYLPIVDRPLEDSG